MILSTDAWNSLFFSSDFVVTFDFTCV